jgi:hypothetical protein
MDEINYSFKPTGQLAIRDIKPDYNISFHNNSEGGTGKEVGKLDFNGPALVFTGDAEESAKVFIDWVARNFAGRLEDERKAEREACAKRRGVLAFCPYTGRPRHPSDIASDPHGILILVPDQPLRGMKP